MAKLDADVWFRFHSESVSTAGADLQRLKDAAAVAGFDMRGAKVTPADEGESRQATFPSIQKRRAGTEP